MQLNANYFENLNVRNNKEIVLAYVLVKELFQNPESDYSALLEQYINANKMLPPGWSLRNILDHIGKKLNIDKLNIKLIFANLWKTT